MSVGRFFGNPEVTAERIIDSWGEQTRTAVAGRHVLATQDTTEVHFRTTPSRRRGLGACGHGNAHGLLMHAMMAVDADSGACLGLVGGKVWNREGLVETPLGQRKLTDRESRRWVETAEEASEVLAAAAMVTVLSDREGEIYPSWARLPECGFHVINRVMSDRRLIGAAKGVTLYSAADGFAVAATKTLDLTGRLGVRQARTARLELRFGAVKIARPVNEKDRSLAKSVPLNLVDVREVGALETIEPLHWRLLTTHDVTDVAEAWRIVGWYQERWQIEQLFRSAKSQGFGLEESQVQTAERLEKLAAATLKAACVTMQLVQERDGAHKLPAAAVFTAAKSKTLAALNPTLEGKTARQRNPYPPTSLARACWVIARLGGWDCYGHPPGPITFHRGMQRFKAIHQGYLLRPVPE